MLVFSGVVMVAYLLAEYRETLAVRGLPKNFDVDVWVKNAMGGRNKSHRSILGWAS